MLNSDLNKDIAYILRSLAAELDITKTQHEQAVANYHAVSDWLTADNSPIADEEPLLYPQGSMALGTTVKPLGQDEFDIDLVCRLSISQDHITQKELRDKIGNRLRSSDRYSKMLTEHKRCWRVSYSREFHLDILPAIPKFTESIPNILLSDKSQADWQSSNPKGFELWFKEQMRRSFLDERVKLASDRNVQIEKVPEWEIRTPLQIAVQLLKRHRDISFEKSSDYQPSSVLITTLVGLTYENSSNLMETLKNCIKQMPSCIENRNGDDWVENPVDPDENFADKWNKSPEYRLKFFTWLEELNNFLEEIEARPAPLAFSESLSRKFGDSVTKTVYEQYGKRVYEKRKTGSLYVNNATGALSTQTGTIVKKHTFYGDEFK